MIKFRRVAEELNIPAQCRKYGLSLWQCPQFLFLVMGVLIITVTVVTYMIGQRYIEDPEKVALITFFLVTVLFILAFSITNSFERLAEANRMKSEFISVVSHQLRSPLSNLKWIIEILMSGRLGLISTGQLDYFRILRENTGRMQELISDLLTVSRIQQGNLPLRKKQASLVGLIDGLIKEFEPFTKASNVKVEFTYAENLPETFVDPFQIRLVIENLLDNAIRYIKDRGEVKIKLEKKDNSIYFEINDDGVGIPKEDQKYIFQKFFRSENIMRYQTQGSGLGLYIAKAIVEKSGGKIGFSSKESKGTIFWFTLPLKS